MGAANFHHVLLLGLRMHGLCSNFHCFKVSMWFSFLLWLCFPSASSEWRLPACWGRGRWSCCRWCHGDLEVELNLWCWEPRSFRCTFHAQLTFSEMLSATLSCGGAKCCKMSEMLPGVKFWWCWIRFDHGNMHSHRYSSDIKNNCFCTTFNWRTQRHFSVTTQFYLLSEFFVVWVHALSLP